MSNPQQMYEALLESMSDMEATTPSFKGMFYGESGVGKTVLALEIAQSITPLDKTIVYIDAVEGWVSLNNHPRLKKRVKRIAYKGLSQLETLAQVIDAQVEPFDNVGAVIFDEASSMAVSDLDVVVLTRAGNPNAKDKDPDVASQPDYNANANRVRRKLEMFLRLPDQHVILLAHQRDDKDNRQVNITRPKFLPALGGTIREMLHVVGYMTASEAVNSNDEPVYNRSIQVHPTKLIVAKTRVGGLPVHVSNERLVERITEWVNQGAPDSNEDETIYDDPVVPGSESGDDAIILDGE